VLEVSIQETPKSDADKRKTFTTVKEPWNVPAYLNILELPRILDCIGLFPLSIPYCDKRDGRSHYKLKKNRFLTFFLKKIYY
jgi:hypothetical protein